jgi:hypothetical protein
LQHAETILDVFVSNEISRRSESDNFISQENDELSSGGANKLKENFAIVYIIVIYLSRYNNG